MKIKVTKPKIVAGIDFGTTESLVKTNQHFCRVLSKLYFYQDGTISSDRHYKSEIMFSVKSIKRLLTEKHPKLNYISDFEFSFQNKQYHISDLIQLVLAHLLQNIIAQYDIIAVMTIPAKFDYSHRVIIASAAEKLNIKVIRMIAEPTAAAFLYSQKHHKHGKFLVYDLGGGTFDLSYVKVRDMMLRVLETNGDAHLGGDDLDAHIADKYQVTLAQAQQMKEDRAIQNIDQLAQSVFQTTVDMVNAYSDDIPLILVGGGSIVMQNVLAKRPNLVLDLDLRTAVVEGAYMYAQSFLKEHSFLLVDVLPISIGIETLGGEYEKIIARNSPLPIMVEKEFTNQIAGQTGIKFNIYQGESSFVSGCKFLTSVSLTGLSKCAPGMLVIKAIFKVNLNGMLEFEAFAEGKQCSVDVDLYKGMQDSDINEILSSYDEKQESLNEKYADLVGKRYAMIRLYNRSGKSVPAELDSYKVVSKPTDRDIDILNRLLEEL